MNYNYILYGEYFPTTDVITMGKPGDLYFNLVCDVRVERYRKNKM